MILMLAGCAGILRFPDRGSNTGANGAPEFHIVHPGETLYSIASRYNLTIHQLARWNGIGKPYTVYPNEVIWLHPGHKHAIVPKSALSRNEATGPAPTASGSKARESSPKDRQDARKKALTWQFPARGRVENTFGGPGVVGKGIVIRGRLGEPVRAAASGTVVYRGNALKGYGELVIIRQNSRFITAYGWNGRVLVDPGEHVKRGQSIARMGKGPKGNAILYFEIRRNGKPVDPLHFLPKAR